MNFIQALRNVYNYPIAENEFSNPSLLYSHLNDLIYDSSYEDKQTLRVFYEIEKRIGLFRAMSEKTDDDLESFYNLYSSVSDLLDEESFLNFVNEIAKAIGIITENAETVSNAEQAQMDSFARFQQMQKQYEWPEKKRKRLTLFLILCLLCIAAMVVGGVMKLPWETYQWIVSAGTAILLLVIGFSLVVALEDAAEDKAYVLVMALGVLNIIFLGVSAIANLCLFIIFKESYSLVCWWVSIPLTILHIIGTIYSKAFDSCIPVLINIGLGCLTVLTFVLNIVL